MDKIFRNKVSETEMFLLINLTICIDYTTGTEYWLIIQNVVSSNKETKTCWLVILKTCYYVNKHHTRH